MRQEIKICLDEIDTCYDRIKNGKSNKDLISNLSRWVRVQKIVLKELGYNGKIRRQPKITAKRIDKGTLFD